MNSLFNRESLNHPSNQRSLSNLFRSRLMLSPRKIRSQLRSSRWRLLNRRCKLTKLRRLRTHLIFIRMKIIRREMVIRSKRQRLMWSLRLTTSTRLLTLRWLRLRTRSWTIISISTSIWALTSWTSKILILRAWTKCLVKNKIRIISRNKFDSN